MTHAANLALTDIDPVQLFDDNDNDSHLRQIMAFTLAELQPGQHGRLLAIKADAGPFRARLLAFGLVPGCEITVVRLAPFGDPIEIRLNDCALALRRAECDVLEIELNA